MLWQIQSTLKETDPQKRLQEIISVVLSNRGINQDSQIFLNPPLPTRKNLLESLTDLNPNQLNLAIEIIKQAINTNQQILIYGDYDCDGVCASSILYQALRNLNANVSVFIPHRVEHGYGLSVKGTEEALKQLNDPLIITVDNGITANETVSYLKDKGLKVIITDHHEPSKDLPSADAVVHTTKLSGSGVAWLLGSFLNGSRLPLDLVALGTVCDLLPLTEVNRSLVKHGLNELETTSRPGLKALFKVGGIAPGAKLDTYHLGFILGPRINAIGRLSHAHDAFKLLIEEDSNNADSLASVLSATNQDRQELTSDFSQIAINHFSNTDLPKVLFLADERFHEGIVGLIASHVSQKYHRPAIIAAAKDGLFKASARSIPGFDLITFLRQLETEFLSLGGHHQAAGLSFAQDHLESIQNRLIELSQEIPDDLLVKKLNIDLELLLKDLNFELLNNIESLAPFGVSNTEPIFSINLPSFRAQFIGKNKTHLKLLFDPPFHNLDAIGFNLVEPFQQLNTSLPLKAAVNLKKNTYLGNVKLQLQLIDIKPIDQLS